MLPTYSRLSNSGNPIFSRKSFRSREKILIILVLLTFGFVCFGGFFLLPDNFGADRVYRAYKELKRAGPEIFIPAPPAAHGINSGEDPHIVGDRAKLAAKINDELGQILEKPELRKNSNGGDEEPNMAVPPFPDSLTEPPASTVLLIKNNAEDPDPLVRTKRNKVKEVSVFFFFKDFIVLVFFFNR